MATTASALTAAGFTLVQGAADRMQLWSGRDQFGVSVMVVFDSVSGRQKKITEDAMQVSTLVLLLYGLVLLVNDFAGAALSAGPKAAVQSALTQLLKED